MVIGPFLTLGPHPIQNGTLHYNNHLDQPFGTLFGHFGTLTSLPCLRLAIFDKKKKQFWATPPTIRYDFAGQIWSHCIPYVSLGISSMLVHYFHRVTEKM